jgi:UDP-N-acetylmuramoylalanine--D-glutamate ligase
MNENWAQKRVTVMGLGRFGGGVGVTRWLAARGARLTVTDEAPAEKLADSLAAIADTGATLHLGGHVEGDFTQADLVVVNPAVPPTSPFLHTAERAGVPITTEINLFLERCRGRTIGVTGSVGKSTTTAMIGRILDQAYTAGRAWVGGNIGKSLLDALPQIAADDVVVLELSSFQLERTPAVGWSPHVAVITNIAPNHVDWHGDFAAYVDAKLNLLRFQPAGQQRVVLGDSPLLHEACEQRGLKPAGAWRVAVTDGAAAARRGDGRTLRWPGLRLLVPGRHNLENAAAALTAAHELGVAAADAAAALGDFAGLPHRLQRVGERDGVTYFNDSKATTPAAAITALEAFEQPVLVILGGYDKEIDLTPAVEAAARKARFAACVGQTGPRMAEAIARRGGRAQVFETFDAAVWACRREARPGEVVLLSPACASWGMFSDYRERGERFVRLVMD